MAADFITDIKARTLEVKTGAKVGGNLDVGNIIRAQKVVISGRDLCDLIIDIERQLHNIEQIRNSLPTTTHHTSPTTHINTNIITSTSPSDLTEIQSELSTLRAKISEITSSSIGISEQREREIIELRALLLAIQQKSSQIETELTNLTEKRLTDLENIVKNSSTPITLAPSPPVINSTPTLNTQQLDEFNFQLRAGISAATEIFERSLIQLDDKIKRNFDADNHIRDKVEKIIADINRIEQQFSSFN